MKSLDNLRKDIDVLDDQIMDLLNKRYEITNKIGKIKKTEQIDVTNKDRENDILVKTLNYKHNLAINKVYKEIMNASKEMQKYSSYLLTGDGSYSYSPMIHSLFKNEYYQIIENISLDELFQSDDYHFVGLNITNPYKKDAYNYAIKNGFYLDEYVNKTKVINFILNDGEIKAFNTDYLGFKALLEYYQVDLNNKDILILGNGSTSSTVKAVCEEYKYLSLNVAVRNIRNNNEILLEDISSLQNIDIVINTTSYGVYPNLELEPLINLTNTNVSIIIDVNYNPNRSILSINNPKVKFINGLYMLIEQARIAEEMIQKRTIDKINNQIVLNQLLNSTLNICLIGMPFSGKTTIGQKLSAKLNKTFYDSDIILKEENLSLSKLLSLGYTLEDYRSYESSVIETLAAVPNCVISTGGGVIENLDNIRFLKQKGLIVFINTSFEVLTTRIKDDRPLVKNESDLLDLYNKRFDAYRQNADIIINGNQDPDLIIQELEVKLNEYFNN